MSFPNNRLDDIEFIDDGEDREKLARFEEKLLRPARNARRKSVTNPRLPGDEESAQVTNSPANSITSINSLASLLREKMQALPGNFKKQKNPDYKTKIFVAMLFVVIICLVSVAYALYHQKVLQKAYFDRIKLNKASRLLKIYDRDGLELARAYLGVGLHPEKSHPCLPGDAKKIDNSVCLEWMGGARLYLSHYLHFKSVKCYNFLWVALGSERNNVVPGDCYDLGEAHWYGGGPSRNSPWSLEDTNLGYSPFITGNLQNANWGNVLSRYFINSKGVALVVDEETPLYVSISNISKEICFKAVYDDFAYVNKFTPAAQLNYSVCVSSDMFDLHTTFTDDSLWDGLKTEDVDKINFLISEPLWEINSPSRADLTEEKVDNFTGKIVTVLGFLKPGHILVNEFWQRQIGDFSVDVRFEEALQIMHRRGFRIVLSLQPFISTESSNFAEAVQKKLLLSERLTDLGVPALTRYKSLQSAGVLDVTNPQTVPWLVEQLKRVQAKFDVDSFYLDLGVAYDMPRHYQSERPLRNADQYKTIFTETLQHLIRVFGVSSAVKLPKAPTFLCLPKLESSWEGLRKVIPTILTYGVVGYPFVISGAVGGDSLSLEGDLDVKNDFEEGEVIPSKELYTRWLQLATFLPVIKYSILPTVYDEKTLNLAKNLTSLRQQKVIPLLKKYVRVSLDTGLPLIRPLWMLDSRDPACHVVVDEFLIGEDLLVAPILHPGSTQREVYLPRGVWKDGISGGFRKGSRWIHDYRVQDDQIAFFEKMPDDTRL